MNWLLRDFFLSRWLRRKLNTKATLQVPLRLFQSNGFRCLIQPMKPHQKLAETITPEGVSLALFEHDGVYTIRQGGQALMDSSVSASESLLGELASKRLSAHASSKILLGSLGLGFTLKSVLQKAGPKLSVHVSERIPTVVEWNRAFLSALNGELLNDPRVKVVVEDVSDVIFRSSPGRYDAIVLEVDDGPTARVQRRNAFLYSPDGIQRLSTALKVGGRLVIWSAGNDRVFSEHLTKAGFKVEMVPAKLYPTAKRFAATVYVADKATASPSDERLSAKKKRG